MNETKGNDNYNDTMGTTSRRLLLSDRVNFDAMPLVCEHAAPPSWQSLREHTIAVALLSASSCVMTISALCATPRFVPLRVLHVALAPCECCRVICGHCLVSCTLSCRWSRSACPTVPALRTEAAACPSLVTQLWWCGLDQTDRTVAQATAHSLATACRTPALHRGQTSDAQRREHCTHTASDG